MVPYALTVMVGLYALGPGKLLRGPKGPSASLTLGSPYG